MKVISKKIRLLERYITIEDGFFQDLQSKFGEFSNILWNKSVCGIILRFLYIGRGSIS